MPVPCVKCRKIYYPGLAGDKNRPTDAHGKKIRISMADYQGYCSKKCQH